MSVHVFFAFSSGLANPITAPAGTLARIIAHIEKVEQTLGLKRTKYLDNPVHWDHFDLPYRQGFPDVPDEVLCETVERHNAFVRDLWEDLGTWSQTPPPGGETITPEDAVGFWHGLQKLSVQPERWTRDYYVARMESLYEVMRGRPSEGVNFDVKPLTPKQAGAVIRIFEQFLDPDDMRLEVPDGHDYLASSYDGGYDWCGLCCKAKIVEDQYDCRRRKCPLKEDLA